MSEDRTEEDTAFDADQLAALARPSLPPAQDRDDDDDDDDGPLDLKALTASMAPSAASDEPEDDEDDDDSRVSMASGAASTSADSSSKVAGAKSSKSKSSKSKSSGKGKGKGKSSKSKSSGKGKGKSSKSKSSGKSTESKDEEKEAVAAVVAAPVEEPQSGGSGKMLIGLIALLGIGGVAFALTQNSDPEEHAALYPAETTTAQHEPDEETTPVGDTTPDETPEPENTEEAVEAAQPDETPEGETEVEAAASPEATPEEVQRRERRARRRGTSMAATMETPEAAETPTTEAAAVPSMEAATVAEPTMEQSTSTDDMDDLLTRALGGTPTAGGTMTEATMVVAMEDRSALPETPSRPAVTRSLGGLMPRMRQCAGDQVGMATARIRVNNNGQVVSANISGSPFGGTPQGACMERVIRTAHFPRFQRTHFDVTYPFSIRAIR